MARRKRHRGGGGHDDHEGGHDERWLVSYSDFITLMFVVFLVLFSMARVDNAKYEGLARSMRASMGPVGPAIPSLPTRPEVGPAQPITEPPPQPPAIGPGSPDWSSRVITEPPKATPPVETAPAPQPTKPTAPPSTPAPPPAAPPDSMGGLEDAFSSLPGVRSGLMSVALEERGLVISIVGSVLFDPGATGLKLEAQALLSQVAANLKGVEFPIMVQGTADETPVAKGGQSLTPWDLAALRAGAVVQYLVDNQGFPGSQFVTIGYGSSGSDGPSRMVTLVVLRKAAQ